MDIETKGAILCIPTSGLVTHLQLGLLKAMGTHNYCNAAVAAFSVLGLDVGIDTDSINSTVETLSLLPHRMQVGKNFLSLLMFKLWIMSCTLLLWSMMRASKYTCLYVWTHNYMAVDYLDSIGLKVNSFLFIIDNTIFNSLLQLLNYAFMKLNATIVDSHYPESLQLDFNCKVSNIGFKLV